MYKFIPMILGVAIAAGVQAESDFHQAWKGGQTSGQIRLGYISSDPDVAGNTTTDATAIGGQLKYETADWQHLQLGLGAYFSKKMHSLSGDPAQNELNTDFLDKDSKSFAYIGEAYINLALNGMNIRVGRQQLDTPFADTDDIRMLPNTFEAVLATYSGIKDTTLVGAYIQQWAGVDSVSGTEGQDEFKAMAGVNGDGTAVVGIVHEGIENLALQGWFYDIDNLAQAFYADVTYGIEVSNGHSYEVAVQFASFDEESASDVDGSAYGLSGVVNMANMTFSVAYNATSNDATKFVTNGFGGGPYFTSMDEMTIDGLTDAEAWLVGAEFDLGGLVTPGLGASIAFGHFEDENKATDVDEMDIVVSYAVNDQLDAELVYADVDNDAQPNDAGTNFSRTLLRVNYNF
ncbi:MAG: OprD family outer membrane porin [Gammaproteobacteria bacterium]|nr:OprD family outer membrane porin [Gammaproteobacteria bacterium]